MGQRLTRPVRRFNAENRAAKALEKQQKAPKAAPKHASTVDGIAQMQSEHPEILSELETKDEGFHQKLKQIYVDSKDPPIQIKSAQPTFQLSRRGGPLASVDLGVMDVPDGEEIPRGRNSLKKIMGFIASHQEAPSQHPVSAIAAEHALDEAAVQNVLAHFKVMQLHIPKEMYKETKSMGKIVAEQLHTSEKIAAGFKLEGGGGQEAQPDRVQGIPESGNIQNSKT